MQVLTTKDNSLQVFSGVNCLGHRFNHFRDVQSQHFSLIPFELFRVKAAILYDIQKGCLEMRNEVSSLPSL